MKRLFLDANVLFSAAHKPESAQGLLIEFSEAKLISAVSSPYAIDEAHRNLARKSPRSDAAWHKVVSIVERVPESDEEGLAWASRLIVPKDAPVLASAARAMVDWLVTGDRADFGHLYATTQRGVLILPPNEAVRRLLFELDPDR